MKPHGALHGIMRVRQFTQDDAHIFCTRGPADRRVSGQVLRPARSSVYRDLGFDKICDQAGAPAREALRSGRRCGTCAEAVAARRGGSMRSGANTAAYGWEEPARRRRLLRPKLEFHLTDAIGRTWQVGTIQADYRAARAARRELCRRGQAKTPAGDAPPRDPGHVRAFHRHPDRAPCRPSAVVARPPSRWSSATITSRTRTILRLHGRLES